MPADEGLEEADARQRAGATPLELGVRDGLLRFFQPGAEEPLPTQLERAEQAEAEVAELRAELEALRGQQGE